MSASRPAVADVLGKLRDRKLRSAVASMQTTRTCDGCDLCCTAVGVESIRKPPGVPCQHLTGDPGASCGIYGNRPHVCRQFFCVWRASDYVLPDDFRPADAGFVVAIGQVFRFPATVCVHPDPERPDAWKAEKYTRLFQHMATLWNCLVVIGQADLATRVYIPVGGWIDRDKNPEAFQDGGRTLAIPDLCFFDDHRAPVTRIAEVESLRRDA
jgi:hypothetical protein